MVGKRGLEPGARDQVVGILGAAAQVGLDLMSDALDRLFVEARRVYSEPLAAVSRELSFENRVQSACGLVVATTRTSESERPTRPTDL